MHIVSKINRLVALAVLHANLQLFLEPEWAIDSQPMRARGIIVLVKSN